MESDGSADEEEVIMNVAAIAYAGESVFTTDSMTPLMSKFDRWGRHRE